MLCQRRLKKRLDCHPLKKKQTEIANRLGFFSLCIICLSTYCWCLNISVYMTCIQIVLTASCMYGLRLLSCMVYVRWEDCTVHWWIIMGQRLRGILKCPNKYDNVKVLLLLSSCCANVWSRSNLSVDLLAYFLRFKVTGQCRMNHRDVMSAVTHSRLSIIPFFTSPFTRLDACVHLRISAIEGKLQFVM